MTVMQGPARSFAFLLVCVGALTACSGGHGASLPASTAAQSASREAVTVSIDVPKTTGASNKRHPQYISPATTQLNVDVQAAGASINGYPTTVGLTPSSTGCTSTLATTQCTLTLSLAPGSYVGTFTTLDAGGASLSAATSVPINVIAGTANSVSVSLSGVPASLHTSVVSTGGATTSALVYALDADSNIIVGPGAPSFTIGQSGTVVALTQPTATQPNTFHVRPSGAGTTQLTVTASYESGATNACGGTIGGVCSASPSMSVANNSRLFVVNENGGSGGNGSLTQFPPSIGSMPVMSTDTGPSSTGVAFDASGNAFVSNSGSPYGGGGTVTEYAPPYTGPAMLTITNGLSTPSGVAIDSHGNLFVSDRSQDLIDEFAPPYTGVPVATIAAEQPEGLAFDSADDLFAADFNFAAVREYSPPYTDGPSVSIANMGIPTDVAVAPGGNIFISYTSGLVSEYAPPYTGGPIVNVSGSGSYSAVTLGPDGTMYAANVSGEIDASAPPYTNGLGVVTGGVSEPSGLNYRSAFTITLTQ
jgi:hypothetical protein